MTMQTLSIGLLGCGTVGSGVVRILQDNANSIEARLGAHLDVKRIAVLDLDKQRGGVDASKLTADVGAVLDDPDIAIVVELIGGTTTAADYVLRAIEQGKHVVTANKTLIAKRGHEIFAAASAKGVDVFFEGAVGGGIPIIRTLRESLASERITSVVGIVNGTTNFILSAMAESGADFDGTLAEAMRLGYAEADPSADVDGHDAGQKLAILAALAFGVRVTDADVHVEGIRDLTPDDFASAARYGYAIKFLAIAETIDGQLAARVHPTWVPNGSMLAGVRGVFNAVLLESDALGSSMLYGQGAGQLPTGSAVAADVIDVARNIRIGATGRVPHLATRAERMDAVSVVPVEDTTSAFYLRFTVADVPGVLGRIATTLGEHGVSLQIVNQEVQGHEQGATVTVVVLTHPAKERHVRAAVAAIDGVEGRRGATRTMRIVDV